MVKLIDATIIGKASYSFTNKEGKSFSGTTCFCTYQRDGITGLKAGRVSIPIGSGSPDLGQVVTCIETKDGLQGVEA